MTSVTMLHSGVKCAYVHSALHTVVFCFLNNCLLLNIHHIYCSMAALEHASAARYLDSVKRKEHVDQTKGCTLRCDVFSCIIVNNYVASVMVECLKISCIISWKWNWKLLHSH